MNSHCKENQGRRGQHCSQLCCSQRGAAMPELAISLGVFLLIVSVVIDLLYLGYRMSVVNYLVNEGVRHVSMQLKSDERVRDIARDTDIEGSNSTALASLKSFLDERAQAFRVKVDVDNIKVFPGAAATIDDACDDALGEVNVGLPRGLITLCIESELGVLFNLTKYNYRVFRVGRNEPSIAMATPPPSS